MALTFPSPDYLVIMQQQDWLECYYDVAIAQTTSRQDRASANIVWVSIYYGTGCHMYLHIDRLLPTSPGTVCQAICRLWLIHITATVFVSSFNTQLNLTLNFNLPWIAVFSACVPHTIFDHTWCFVMEFLTNLISRYKLLAASIFHSTLFSLELLSIKSLKWRSLKKLPMHTQDSKKWLTITTKKQVGLLFGSTALKSTWASLLPNLTSCLGNSK